MARDLSLRPPTSRDLDAIAAIEVESFPMPWKRSFFASELTAEGRYNLVAVRGGRLVGYLFAMWLFDEMHINKIAVTSAERRHGIARALMNECLAFARNQHVTTLSLEVRMSNEVARNFYESFEFDEAYIRPRYYPDGEAAVVMIRSL
ncbi:MAG TPA: ribosomal protein S18-alanine N-acetyltransferase [Thermoanaerobaculia bacterium]|nr:ribosomal protein S18-alanine N-acetyltransferase [Thermoanaerobaculia bacterium]